MQTNPTLKPAAAFLYIREGEGPQSSKSPLIIGDRGLRQSNGTSSNHRSDRPMQLPSKPANPTANA